MAKKWGIKNALEWMEHGKTLFDLVVAVGGGAIVRAVLHQFTQIPGVWITPIWLLSSAGLFWGLLKILGHGVASQTTIQSTSTSAPLVSAPATFDATNHFRVSYTSQLTTDIERNIRVAAQQNQPNDREGFLARIIGIGLISYLHDLTWAYIYKSQLLALMELNRRDGWMPLADVKTFYDSAATEFPAAYANYPFAQWLEFMRAHELFIRHPSDMIEITVRGKDLLKYLTHWGRYADDRRL